MKTVIHAKAIDPKVRTALYGMLEFCALKLFPKRMKNVSIKLHLKHYEYEGEALIEEDTRIKNPRNFRVIIDPYKLEKDDWGRELNYSEWVSKILRTLGHEMVHVKQYIMGELTFKAGALSWKSEKVGWMSEDEYYCSPHEVEAYGKEKWLQLGYTAVWNEIESREGNRLQKL